MSNVQLTWHVILPNLLQPIKTGSCTPHIILLPAAAAVMATIRQPAVKGEACPGGAVTARRLVRHLSVLSVLPCQSRFPSPDSAAVAPVLHQIRREQVRVWRFLPCTWLSATFGIRRHLKDEYINTLADFLPKMLLWICNGETGAAAAAVGCESGTFLLSLPKTTDPKDCITTSSILAWRNSIYNILPEIFTSYNKNCAITNQFARRSVLRGIVLIFSDVCRTCA